MVKWEYFVQFVFAEQESSRRDPDVRKYIEENYSQFSGTYNPKYLEAWLNVAGLEGWELVRIEPVGTVGNDWDWKPPHVGGTGTWIRSYFVILRREIEEIEEID